jgi:hypothetical protein
MMNDFGRQYNSELESKVLQSPYMGTRLWISMNAYNSKMGTTLKHSISKLTLLILMCIGSLLSLASFPSPEEKGTPHDPTTEPIQLEIKPLQQKKITSCGEAAITMAYNHANPESPLAELDIVAFAMDNGYYIDDRRPFTSPANMVIIAQHYTDKVNAGNIMTPEQGLALLFENLHQDTPVIIDIWTYLDIPYSDAHFVLVTGISQHPHIEGAYIIHYNNPLTAKNESARWEGRDGIWNAWQNNGDPDGSGWWMTIQPTE